MSEDSSEFNRRAQKTWVGQKTRLGMPVNWDWKNWRKQMWDDEDDRLIAPKRVGIGWAINFHAVLKRSGILK